MDPLRVLAETDGFFARAHAREAGYDDRAVAAAIRSKRWHRFRRGYYTFTDLWSQLDAIGRHRVRSAAVLHSLGDVVALSHVSGVIAHGIDIWNVDLERVHVTRLDGGSGRIEGDVVHHEGFSLDDEVVLVEGQRVMLAERCAIEAASLVGTEEGLVMADSLLHRRLATPEALMARFDVMAHWPRVQHLHVVLRLADGRAESVGESRGRHLFWVYRLPCPELQFEVRDSTGELLGTCDWAWPEEGLLGEFDGKVKYGRLLKPGQEPGDAVFAEKRREDLMREATRMGMVRLIWSDYGTPGYTANRVRRFMRNVS